MRGKKVQGREVGICEQSELLLLQGAYDFFSIAKMLPLGLGIRGNLIREPYKPVTTVCNVTVRETLMRETHWPVAIDCI